jgi:hypothetical protein
MDEDVRALGELACLSRVAHVAADLDDVPLDRVLDRGDVEGPDFVAVSHKRPGKVQTEEARAA